MKALTICQPYAHLIVRGEKRVENRDWPTRYRGPLLIHAGKARNFLDPLIELEMAAAGDPLVFGALVGRCNLVDVVTIEDIRAGRLNHRFPWLRSHKHCFGAYCWVLADVQRYAVPIPCVGAQGLWEPPA